MSAAAIALFEHDDRSEWARWSLAAAIVFAAHAGLLASSLLWHSNEPPGAPEAPAIIIDLMPLPAAPASPMDVVPQLETQQEQPKPEPPLNELPPPVIEPPPPAPSPTVVLPEPPPRPEVKPQEKPPEPQPKKVERQRSVSQPEQHKSDRDAARPVAPSLGAGASRQAIATWSSLVAAKLRAAQRSDPRRPQGSARLSFTLDRAGRVLSRSVSRSSGHSELDQEVLAMVQRAAPFPPMPAEIPGPSYPFSIQINFSH
jgi:protein TonB